MNKSCAIYYSDLSNLCIDTYAPPLKQKNHFAHFTSLYQTSEQILSRFPEGHLFLCQNFCSSWLLGLSKSLYLKVPH